MARTPAAPPAPPGRITRTRKFTPIPGPPLQCPECPYFQAQTQFNPQNAKASENSNLKVWFFASEADRDIHYFQCHILGIRDTKVRGELVMDDEGNYDGPLGKEKHVFYRSRLCTEPESYLPASSTATDKQANDQGEYGSMTLDDTLAQIQVHDTMRVKLPMRKKDFKAYFEHDAKDM